MIGNNKMQENIDKFKQLYGDEGEILVFHSPGRVNLIGEHTDYNGGYVFPCALSLGTYGYVRKRDDTMLRLASTNFELQVTTDVKALKYEKKHGWGNYLKGVVSLFVQKGFDISGMDILISGNIPNSSGLSSSASVEMLMAFILNSLFDCRIGLMELVKIAQKSEHEFIGVNCGIMDQFSIGFGKKDMAMLLNCKTLDYEYVPVRLLEHCIVITNTNKPRGLAGSKYNERCEECAKALMALQSKITADFLCDISPEQFDEYENLIKEETIRKRARHVIHENARALKSSKCLRANNLEVFGELMNRSHLSLRELYDVTGFELDTLAEAAWSVPGTIGSRMTGAGFGGCTVSLVQKNSVEEFKALVAERYKAKTGLSADFYIAEIGDGVKQI